MGSERDKMVVVRWLGVSALIVDGLAYARRRGDEDLLPDSQARQLCEVGFVEISSPVALGSSEGDDDGI